MNTPSSPARFRIDRWTPRPRKTRPARRQPTKSRADRARASSPRSVEAAARTGGAHRPRQHRRYRLGGKAHAVLAKLVERPEEVAVRTITELADSASGVNASTLDPARDPPWLRRVSSISRMCSEIAWPRRHRHFYSQQAERLVAGASRTRARPALGRPIRPKMQTVVQLARESIENVEGFLAQLVGRPICGARPSCWARRAPSSHPRAAAIQHAWPASWPMDWA